MISKIENAQTSPSLRTLARLSQALEVPVTTFFRGFEEERDASYVRAGEGIELVRQGTRHGHRYELLAAAKGAQRRVQPFLVTLTEQRETFPLFQHVGVEFLYALEGSFVYRYGRQTYPMDPGDSLMFDGQIAARTRAAERAARHDSCRSRSNSMTRIAPAWVDGEEGGRSLDRSAQGVSDGNGDRRRCRRSSGSIPHRRGRVCPI